MGCRSRPGVSWRRAISARARSPAGLFIRAMFLSFAFGMVDSAVGVLS
jgi:hypothetical protein